MERVISRSAGRSATASAAYREAEKIKEIQRNNLLDFQQ